MGKRKKQIPGWLQPAAAGLVRGGLALPLVAGLDESVEVAGRLARVYARVQPTRIRRACEHIRQAFPSWEEARVERTARASCEHLFTLAVELIFAPRLLHTASWPRHVEIGDAAPAIATLLDDRPCLLVTGHCGNWEVLGYTLAMLGFPIHALYRPLDLKPLDLWVRRTRERRGLTLLDKFGAAERIPKLVSPPGGGAGVPIGFVADQNAGDRGLFVPFFGRMASTYKSIGLTAMRFDLPIVCGYARRMVPGVPPPPPVLVGEPPRPILSPASDPDRHDRLRYRIECTDVIRPADWAGMHDPLFYITARYRRAIEAMVRTSPEQYLWMHRIWKSRPRHEHLGRRMPAGLREKLRALPWMTPEELERIEARSAKDAEALGGSEREPETGESGEGDEPGL